MDIYTNTGGSATEAPHVVREVLLTETLTVGTVGQAIASIVLIGTPETQPAIEIGGATATIHFDAPGRYGFRIAGAFGGAAELQVVACEPEALAALPHGEQSAGGTSTARGILRSLANHAPWFAGKRSELFNQSLKNFGG